MRIKDFAPVICAAILLILMLQACNSAPNPTITADILTQEMTLPPMNERTEEGLDGEPVDIVTVTSAFEPVAPTPVSSVTPFLQPTPTLVPTQTAAPASTMAPWYEHTTIGYSYQGRAIEVHRFGSGSTWLVAIGALHGAHECNTNQLMAAIVDRLVAEPTLLPDHVTLYIVPIVNLDGCAAGVRENANGVDLNRNWQTDDWITDAQGPAGVVAGSGGIDPFSEPETASLAYWLQQLRDLHNNGQLNVISYHSMVAPGGLVQPGYREQGAPDYEAQELARAYAGASGYTYSPIWVGTYRITGELIHWATENNLVAIDVELPDGNVADSIPVGWSETHIETNLRSLLSILSDMDEN